MKPLQFREKYTKKPAPAEKEDKGKLREEMNAAIAVFLEKGGEIKVIPSGISAGSDYDFRRNYAINPARSDTKKSKPENPYGRNKR